MALVKTIVVAAMQIMKIQSVILRETVNCDSLKKLKTISEFEITCCKRLSRLSLAVRVRSAYGRYASSLFVIFQCWHVCDEFIGCDKFSVLLSL